MTWHTKLLALTSGVADAPDGTESPQGPRALATHTHTHTQPSAPSALGRCGDLRAAWTAPPIRPSHLCWQRGKGREGGIQWQSNRGV